MSKQAPSRKTANFDINVAKCACYCPVSLFWSEHPRAHLQRGAEERFWRMFSICVAATFPGWRIWAGWSDSGKSLRRAVSLVAPRTREDTIVTACDAFSFAHEHGCGKTRRLCAHAGANQWKRAGATRVLTGGPSSEVKSGCASWLPHSAQHTRARATWQQTRPFDWINSRLRTGIQRWLSPAVFPSPAPLSASLPWLFLAGGSGTRTADFRGGRNVGGSTNTSRQVRLKTAHKAGNLSEEPELKRLGWSISFFSCGRASTRELLRAWSSVGGASLLLVALVSRLHSHHQKVSGF